MSHTKRQLDALNRMLFELPDDSDAMPLSEFDGLVVCPEVIPPSEWLPVVWGRAKAPDFEDAKEAQTTHTSGSSMATAAINPG